MTASMSIDSRRTLELREQWVNKPTQMIFDLAAGGGWAAILSIKSDD